MAKIDPSIFKAYDVRGVYPAELDERIAFAIGYHFRGILEPEDLARGARVVVSHDMRASSLPLSAALADGLRTAGLGVVHIGLATTPMNYFATGSLHTAGGIQVTASHNPARYNGCKFSRRDAIPVSSETGIGELERLVKTVPAPDPEPTAAVERRDVTAAYAEHVLSFLGAREPPAPGGEPAGAPPAAPGATDRTVAPAEGTPVVPAVADEEITTTPQAAPEKVAPPAAPPRDAPPPGR